ncbi:MAG: hypothetical protein JW986_03770 [Methanotrichaceae archaeon]|nr:hypothetical protein [Methanotrichaceae archaeon]
MLILQEGKANALRPCPPHFLNSPGHLTKILLQPGQMTHPRGEALLEEDGEISRI